MNIKNLNQNKDELSWEDFVKSTPEDDITDEINKDILEKLNQNKDE